MKEKLETLVRQHDELRALADHYEAELSRAEPDLPALAKYRWTLARLVGQHLALERLVLGRCPGEAQSVVVRFTQQQRVLATQLDEHVRNWTADAIAGDWANYGRKARALMTIMRAHMVKEEAELYPMLLQAKAA